MRARRDLYRSKDRLNISLPSFCTKYYGGGGRRVGGGGENSNKAHFERKAKFLQESGDFAGNRETGLIFLGNKT